MRACTTSCLNYILWRDILNRIIVKLFLYCGLASISCVYYVKNRKIRLETKAVFFLHENCCSRPGQMCRLIVVECYLNFKINKNFPAIFEVNSFRCCYKITGGKKKRVIFLCWRERVCNINAGRLL